jgi:hypothetical protein
VQELSDKILGGNLTADEWNEVAKELENLITDTGNSLSDLDLDQIGKAIAGMVAASDYYTAGGTANALTATKIGAKQAPRTGALDAVHDGLRVRLRPGAVNTGAATLAFNGEAAKDIKRENGNALSAGDLDTTRDAVMRWDNASGDFFLLNCSLPLVGEVPRGYIDGLITEHDVTDLTTDILINPGVARDDLNLGTISLGTGITKQIDNNWSAGDDAGGFPSGLSISLDTWYHMFVIRHPDGTVDGGFDSNLDANKLLDDATGYTWYRRIGSVIWESGPTIRQYTQRGDDFIWEEFVMDVDAQQVGAGLTDYALRVPLGVRVHPLCSISVHYDTAENYAAYGGGDAVLNDTIDVNNHDFVTDNAVDVMHQTATPWILTDLLRQIQIKRSGNLDLEIVTHGWVDPRGRNA